VRSSAVRTSILVGANLVGLAAFAWPFLIPAVSGGTLGHERDAPWIFAALLLLLGAVLALELGRGGMGSKAVALVGVLGAAMVALRLPGYVAGFSAMFVVVLLAGNAFGAGFGFVLGAVGTFASGLFVGGLGPWLPFQMVAVGWVGVGAGLMPRLSGAPGQAGGRWVVRIGALAGYGAVAAFFFGGIMNLWFWPFQAGSSEVGWAPALGMAKNVRRYAAFYLATSAWWDAYGAVGNAVAVVALGRPVLGALDRAARRMHFETRRRVADRSSSAAYLGVEEPAGWPRPERAEESPGSAGQDAGENPRRGDPRQVQQRADRPGFGSGKGERVR
jgi:energy-coupling factor transport system substrate-specific component